MALAKNEGQPNKATTERVLEHWDLVFPAKSGVEGELERAVLDAGIGGNIPWLWPNRIPFGRVTLIEGPGGSGKSLVALDLVARLSDDRPWPDGAPQPHPGSKAVIVCRQDHRYDVVGARLERMGTEPERLVQFHELEKVDNVDDPEPGETRPLEFPADLHALEKLISVDKKIKLVVIDPLSDFCGSKKLLAETIHRLNRLADENQIAIVITLRAAARFNRQGELVVKSRHDTEAARCQWCCLADPEDPARRLFVPTLMNYARLPKGQAFQPGEMMFDWLPGEVDLNDPLRNITPSGKWLKEILKGGPRPAQELKDLGKKLGFSEGQLQRAVYELGGTKERDDYRKGSKSMWSLEERLATAVEAELRARAEAGQPADIAPQAQQKDDRNQIPSLSMGESRRAGTAPQTGEGEKIASHGSQVSSESCGASVAPGSAEPAPVAVGNEPVTPVESAPTVAPVQPVRPLSEQVYIPWDDSPSSRLNPLSEMLDAPANPNQLRRNVKSMKSVKSNEEMRSQTETKSKEHESTLMD